MQDSENYWCFFTSEVIIVNHEHFAHIHFFNILETWCDLVWRQKDYLLLTLLGKFFLLFPEVKQGMCNIRSIFCLSLNTVDCVKNHAFILNLLD